MTTLTDLGWTVSEDRTDPPTRETDAYRPINNGSTGLLMREKGNGAAVLYMETPAEVEP